MEKISAKTDSLFRRFVSGFIFISGLIIFTGGEAYAQGNLLITPRRVVFEGTKRTQELNLANTGADSARYNVSMVQYRMKEDGSFEEITTPDPGQNFADKYIRFFPRSVLLGPNEAQVVRMQLSRTENLAPGEYRSHVYFRAVPRETALGMQDNRKKDTASIGVKLIPIFGITIPVIIRVGTSTTKTSLSDLKLEMVNDTTPRLHLVFNRSGNMSVYGDILVDYLPVGGKPITVGTVKGIAVYTPNSRRIFGMELQKKPEVDFHRGSLHLTYQSQSDTKPEKYAEADLTLK